MDLRPYVENIHQQLVIAAEAGGEDARALAERLVAPLDAAVRLTLQDVLAAAAEEITCELAPGSVEVRLRGRDPEFVVTPPVDGLSIDGPPGADDDQQVPNGWQMPAVGHGASAEADSGEMSRINLRMPDQLKLQVERAAGAEGLSVNAWVVRAATVALSRTDPVRQRERSAPRGGQRYTGWAR